MKCLVVGISVDEHQRFKVNCIALSRRDDTAVNLPNSVNIVLAGCVRGKLNSSLGCSVGQSGSLPAMVRDVAGSNPVGNI